MLAPPRLHFVTLTLASLASLPVARARAQSEIPDRLSLRQAVDRALAANPLVVESTLEWRRAQGAASGVAGALAENPLLSVEAGLHRDQGWTGNQGAIGMRVEQPLDLFGQSSTRRRAMSDLVEWSRARLALARTEVGARAHAGYVAAQVAEARIALDEERLASTRQTAEALAMRVRLGASSDIDLRMAQAEVGRAEAELHGARAESARARLALRELLALPATAGAVPSDRLTSAPSAPVRPANERELLAHHTSVQVVEKRRLAIDSEIARLRRERVPRLSIAFTADRPSEYERYWGVGLSFAPALWRRNQGPLAEARVERERADWEKATTLVALERRLAALVEEQGVRFRELAAVDGTLANEESVRDLVRTGWEAGKFDFLRLLLAERAVADTKQARLDLWAELWTNVIEINRLLGQEP